MPASVSARTPAQLYALLVGLGLVAGGVLGFFYNASFATGDAIERDAVLGILEVNAWHNLVHIATGVLALAVAGSYNTSRVFALAFGVAYLLVAALGFVAGDGEAIVSLVPVNTEDNVLHVLISLAGLLAFAATPATPAPTDGRAGCDPGPSRSRAGAGPSPHRWPRGSERAGRPVLLAGLAGPHHHERARGRAAHHHAAAGRYQLRGSRMDELPVGQLLGRGVGQAGQPLLEAVGHGPRRLDGNQGAAQ